MLTLKQYLLIILFLFIFDSSLAVCKENICHIPFKHSTHRIEPKKNYTHHQWIKNPKPYNKPKKVK